MITKYLKRNGTKPFDELEHSYDELFLCFATMFGITTEEVHRKAIYNYIQTHYSAISESSLQGSLEKSNYWNRVDAAYYCLNEAGLEKLYSEFVPDDEKALIFPIVVFRCYLGNDLIGVKSYPSQKGYDLFLNSQEVDTETIYDFLHEQGIELPTNGVSKPREVLSWLLKENYTWEIMNYDEIIKDIVHLSDSPATGANVSVN